MVSAMLGGDGKMTEIDLFQREVADRLTLLLVQQGYEAQVKVPWSAFSGHGRRTYSPQVDIAVGPFAVKRGYENEYDLMVNSFHWLIDTWIDRFRQNWRMHSVPFAVDLWRVQNLYHGMLESAYPEFQERAQQGDEVAGEWLGQFVSLGQQLSIRVG
jgi:hypothetical protein